MAIHVAQWCSERFALMVTNWVEELLTTGSVTVKTKRQRKIPAGQGGEWLEVREDGVEVRKEFTGTLKAHGVDHRGYPRCTNAINAPVLGGSAAQVRRTRHLPAKAPLRDHLPKSELIRLQFAESMAAERIERDDIRGNDGCEKACALSGRAVAAAMRMAREGSL